MAIKKAGIIGAGTMGNGIAQACAVTGIPVVMVDINDAAVSRGIATVSGSLDRLVKKEKMTAEQKAKAMALIQGRTKQSDLQGCFFDDAATTESRSQHRPPPQWRRRWCCNQKQKRP